MKIILAGPKGTGKSTCGMLLAERLNVDYIETDVLVEEIFSREFQRRASCREICMELGEDEFRRIEAAAVREAAQLHDVVISTGGGTLMNPASRHELQQNAYVVLLIASPDALWRRTVKNGIPSYLTSDNPAREFKDRVSAVMVELAPFADVTLDTGKARPKATVDEILKRLPQLTHS